MPDYPGAARADGQPHRDFLAPFRRPRQQHVGDVRSGDQENDPAQHRKVAGNVRQPLFGHGRQLAAGKQRDAAAIAVAARVARLLLNLPRHRFQFRFRALRRHSRPQPDEYVKDRLVPPLQGVIRQFRGHARRRADRQPEIGAVVHRRGALEVLRANADHRADLPVDAQRLTDRGRVRAHPVSPEFVAQHHRWHAPRLLVLLVEEPAERRIHAQCGEV